MDKNLKQYEQFIKTEIEKFENILKNGKEKSENIEINQKIKNLYQYHTEVVRNFQHERLIHLIVTFFFGGLLILSIIAPFVISLLPISNSYTFLTTLTLFISFILLVTETFYIKYYYELENGTQRL